MATRSGDIIFLAAVLAVLAGGLAILAPVGLYSNEEGVRYVQMKNLALSGSLEIAWPGADLGFDAKDLTGPGAFFESRSGRLYAITPPFFPWLASLLFPLVGERVVEFAPILFVFLSALVLGMTLDRVMPRGVLYYLLVAAFGVGSPVLLSAFRYSGQSLSLCLVAMGLFLLVHHLRTENQGLSHLAGSSFLVGAAVVASPEYLFVSGSFLLAAGTVFSIQKRWAELVSVAAGGALALAAFALHESIFQGGLPGPYLQAMWPDYEFSGVRSVLFAGCFITSLSLFAASRRKGISPFLRAVLTVMPVVLLLITVSLTAARITVSRLMAVFPAVLFVFYGLPGRMDRVTKREGSLEAILAGTVILCLTLGAVIHRPDLKRILAIWLPLVPFVILLLGAEHRRIFDDSRGMYVVLILFCGVALLNNLQEVRSSLWLYKDYNGRRIEFLRQHTAAGDAILFYDAASMEHAGPLFFERVFLVPSRTGDQERFTCQLSQRGHGNTYAWTLDPFRDVSGFDPYRHEAMQRFPLLSTRGSCCGRTCRDRNVYLVRLDTRCVRTNAYSR